MLCFPAEVITTFYTTYTLESIQKLSPSPTSNNVTETFQRFLSGSDKFKTVGSNRGRWQAYICVFYIISQTGWRDPHPVQWHIMKDEIIPTSNWWITQSHFNEVGINQGKPDANVNRCKASSTNSLWRHNGLSLNWSWYMHGFRKHTVAPCPSIHSLWSPVRRNGSEKMWLRGRFVYVVDMANASFLVQLRDDDGKVNIAECISCGSMRQTYGSWWF